MFDTIDKIVDDLITSGKVSPEDLNWIKAMSLNDAKHLHHSLGMWIRNTYDLWHTSPLTEKWRTDPSSHDIRDGVDYSEDHPDQVSSNIITTLWHKLQETK